MRQKEYDSIIDGVSVPFSAHGDASDVNANKGRRVREVAAFLDDIDFDRVLDIGPPNAFSKLLFGEVDNTSGDVNRGIKAPGKNYDLILFSEIIEHLMNPLRAVEECYALLKPGGCLVVSTPKMAWHSGISYQSPHHFTEYRVDRFRRMLEYAGFEVIRYRTINIWDWSFALKGLRPLLRVLFHRSQLWLLRKP